MGIFGEKPFDPNEELLKKEMKRHLTKAEIKQIRKAAAKGKYRRKIVSGAGAVIVGAGGKIMDIGPFKKVKAVKERLNDSRCPGCGKGMPRKGYFCPSCAKDLGPEFNFEKNTSGLGKGIPDGQNLMGAVFCKNGHRAFFYEVEGKWNCSSGCNN
jgi:hypothetical protein